MDGKILKDFMASEQEKREKVTTDELITRLTKT